MPYVGEIRMFGGTFAPNGWLFCDGRTLSIAENDTLFQLLGTTYGGDGEETFKVPDLRGRVPLHNGTGAGASYMMGESGGTETVALNATHIASHTHALNASTAAASAAFNASTGLPANTGGTNIYGLMGTPAAMATGALGASQGGIDAHENMAPYLGINFIISLFGLFPSQT